MNRHRRCTGGVRQGSHMGEILNELFKQGPDIIGKAAQKPVADRFFRHPRIGRLGIPPLARCRWKTELLVLAMIRYSLLRYLLGYEPSKIHKIDHRFILWADPA